MSEQQIQNQIYTIIRRKHVYAGTEISVLNRCIDIAYFDKNKKLITIEIKLKDWRRAIKQASDHQLYADMSYICLPKPRKEKKINQDLKCLLEKLGIGLIWFNYEKGASEVKIEKFIKAQNNYFCWAPARKKIEGMLYA